MAPSPNTSPTPLLEGNQLSIRFGTRFVFGPLSLSVEAQHHLSLLGPSGSGKSTLLRLLTGHLVPDSGQITAFGRRQNLADQLMAGFSGIRYVFQDAQLPAFQRVRDSFRRELAHLSPDAQLIRIEALAKRFEITALLDFKPEEVSLGQRQRCALALAFASRPALIALDEPFSHQDAWLRQQMLEAVRQETTDSGTTLLLCTHSLEEAHYLTNQACYLKEGQLLYQGEIAGLKALQLPEVQALYGWASPWAKDWAHLEITSKGSPFTVTDCRSMGNYYLLVGHLADGRTAWAQTGDFISPGATVYVQPRPSR